MNLNLNWRRKRPHRAAGIQTGSREQTAVPSVYAARAVWPALAVYQLDWMQVFYPEPFVYIHPSSAKKKGISENDLVKVFNGTGEVELRAKVTTNVPEDFLVMYEAWFPKRQYNVQNVVADTPADMGLMKTGAPGAAIHSQFADVVLIGKGNP